MLHANYSFDTRAGYFYVSDGATRSKSSTDSYCSDFGGSRPVIMTLDELVGIEEQRALFDIG